MYKRNPPKKKKRDTREANYKPLFEELVSDDEFDEFLVERKTTDVLDEVDIYGIASNNRPITRANVDAAAINARRERANKLPYSPQAFTDLLEKAKLLREKLQNDNRIQRKIKNDFKSKKGQRKKDKRKKAERKRERIAEKRIVKQEIYPGWSEKLKIAQERGYYNPRDLRGLPKSERLEVQVAAYKKVRKNIMLKNKREAKKKRNLESKKNVRAQKREELLQRRHDSRMRRIERRRQRRQEKEKIETEAGSYSSEDDWNTDEEKRLDLPEYVPKHIGQGPLVEPTPEQCENYRKVEGLLSRFPYDQCNLPPEEEDEEITDESASFADWLPLNAIYDLYGETVSHFDGLNTSLFSADAFEFITNTISYVYLAYKAETLSGILSCTQLYLSSIGVMRKVIDYALTHSRSLFKSFLKRDRSDDEVEGEISTEALSDNVKSLKGIFEMSVNNRLVKSVINIVTGAVSMDLLSTDISVYVMQHLGTFPSMSMQDFVITILDSISHVLKCAERIWSGMPICDALLSDDPVMEFFQEAKWLVNNSDNLYTGMKVEGFYSFDEWVERAEKNISLGEHLVKYESRKTGKSIKNFLQTLHRTKHNVESRKSTCRMMPMFFVVHGTAGVGKSAVTLQLIKKIDLMLYGPEKPFERSKMYNKDYNSQYWDQYQPRTMPYVFYAELGNKAGDLVKTQGDDVLLELNRLIDRHPFRCNMAALEDKGKILADPKVIIAETNNPGLNLEKAMHTATAIKRRAIYLEVIVKPEFCVDGGTELDQVKCAEAGNHGDFWLFKIGTYTTIGGDSVYKEHTIDSIYDFNKYIADITRAHFEREKLILEHSTKSGFTMAESPYEEEEKDEDRKSVV